MANLIHINTMRAMLKSGEAFSLKFWRLEDAEIIALNIVICTSDYHHGNTINVKSLTSNVFRKIRVITIFEINDLEVFI
jgi:hypothetical protein